VSLIDRPTNKHVTLSSDSSSNAWRVILVGRTGLDQVLRRQRSIELIRARDTIDAIGELSDPIDENSPSSAVVIVASSAEPQAQELGAFISSLRLIEPGVRVLRVGSVRLCDESDESSEASSRYDGMIAPDASLAKIMESIESIETSDTQVELRFISSVQEPVQKPDQDHKTEPESTDANAAQMSVTEAEPSSTSDPEIEAEVVVVVENETFEHRAQDSFGKESDIHRQVLLGAADQPITEPDFAALSHANQSAKDRSQKVSDQPSGVVNDQVMVEMMLKGHSVLDAALELINCRLGRSDIVFEHESEAIGMPVMVGDQTAGKLVTADHAWAMGAGHHALAHHAEWLSMWIKLEIQQRELRNSAFTDSLTGAWNRRYFDRYLDAAIVQARHARQPLTVMLFDIDEFKHYNDTYSHAAGDEILIETVKLLKSVIRPSDRVCRVGGDEFVVIFYEPDGPRDPSSKPLESVYQIAKRFQRQICTHRFPKLSGDAMGTLTVSGGLASFPWDGHDANSLLEQADQLAMKSKSQGKNAITLGPGAQSVCGTDIE
jgi:diguanylate cyclase (GGDEF)-like protein